MGNYDNPFEFDFDSYIREVEPCKQEKGKNWATAIGLQKVDGLTPSKYLYETAKRNIEGEISIEEAKKIIDSYYESKDFSESISAILIETLSASSESSSSLVRTSFDS